MTTDSKLRAIKRNFKQRGSKAMKNARKGILRNFKDNSYSSQALRYFSKVTLHNALPVFPALIAISCEAVGGNAERTIPVGEAIVLISAAADLHDDVIDQSFVKGTKQTVMGKFGAGTTILAGDILLVQGFKQLTEALESVPKMQSKEILKLVSDAVFEICRAESLEGQLYNRLDLTPNEYHEVIKLKAVVPELAMKIGAILGNGCVKDVKNLGKFGRTYGINSIIIEEFVDLLDTEELKNRLKNECPPLPIIYALQNSQIRASLIALLNAEMLDENAYRRLVDTVLDLNEMQVLQKILMSNATSGLKKLPKIVNEKIREELKDLLFVPPNFFET